MRQLGGFEPLVPVDFVIANNMAHAVGENLSAPARQRVHPRGFQLFQRLTDRELGPLRKISDLDHGEGLQMYLRKALLQARAQIEEVLKWQVWMQPTHDVKLGDRLGVSRGRGFESLFERHGVSAGRIFLSSKRAQPARRHANICRINMPVDIEICFVAVHALAHRVGQPAHGQNVARAVQGKGIVGIKALTGNDFFMNRR